MKRLKAWLGRVLNNRKLRCGGFSAALTASVVLLELLAGVLADSVEQRYALQADFSFNAATTQGPVTDAALAQLDKDVHIYAVTPDGGGDEDLLSLLNRYDAASGHVEVSRENLIRNPVLQTRYSGGTGEKQVTENCLIVACAETGKSRVLTAEDYTVYAWNTGLWAYEAVQYSYEKAITEAILYVSQEESPVIQILEGHGEMTAEDTSLLEYTLTGANYEVRRVSLAAGDELDPTGPLMILSPAYDLADWELEKLMEFAGRGGDFFVICRYTDPLDLSNYSALLRAYGVEPYPGVTIAKEEDTGSYYPGAPVVLMPYMQETPVTRPLLDAGQDILLLSAARAFRMGDLVPEDVLITPVLMTGQAYIRHYEDGLDVTDQQPGDEEGTFAVALWAEKLLETGEVSQLFVMGDGSMFLDPWVQSSTASTAFLTQVLRSLQGQSPVDLDILPKEANRPGLSLGNITPGVIVTVMLPLLAALGAALVLWPRRNL